MLSLCSRQLSYRISWFSLLFFIPLLSYSGRNLQYFLNNHITAEALGMVLGLLLLFLVFIGGYWLYRVNSKVQWLTLLWFVPLFIIVPMLLPVAIERMHFIVFGLFGFVSLQLWAKSPGLLVCLLVAVLDEVFQWWLPDRVGDLRDVLINVVAVYGGALLALSGKKT